MTLSDIIRSCSSSQQSDAHFINELCLSDLYVESTKSDFNVITALARFSLCCFTEQLHSLLALTESCSYYFIHFQSSVASTYHYVQCHGRASKDSLILSALWKGWFRARLATHFEHKRNFATIQIEESKNSSMFQELPELGFSLLICVCGLFSIYRKRGSKIIVIKMVLDRIPLCLCASGKIFKSFLFWF